MESDANELANGTQSNPDIKVRTTFIILPFKKIQKNFHDIMHSFSEMMSLITTYPIFSQIHRLIGRCAQC